MFDVDWDETQEKIFKAVLRIANYTGFNKDEVLNWTIDEMNKALEFITESENRQAALLFSLQDYQRLISFEPTKKDGSLDKTAYSKAQNKASELRSFFTGEEKVKEQNNSRFFEARGERIVYEMTIEEYKEYKESKKYNYVS